MVDDTDEAIRKCNCLTELYRPLYFKGYVKFMKMSIFLLNFLIWGEKKYTHTHTYMYEITRSLSHSLSFFHSILFLFYGFNLSQILMVLLVRFL